MNRVQCRLRRAAESRLERALRTPGGADLAQWEGEDAPSSPHAAGNPGLWAWGWGAACLFHLFEVTFSKLNPPPPGSLPGPDFSFVFMWCTICSAFILLGFQLSIKQPAHVYLYSYVYI